MTALVVLAGAGLAPCCGGKPEPQTEAPARATDAATAEASSDVADEPESSLSLPDDALSNSCSAPAAKPNCTNGWCRIEPGCFVMGAPRDEFGAGAYDDVQVVVTLTRPFLLQQMELTQREWTSAGVPNPRGETLYLRDCHDPSCPAGGVTWFDTLWFANHLSRTAEPPLPECYTLEGCTGAPGEKDLNCTSVQINAKSLYDCAGYRLPTEAEWEYAARAGTTTAVHTGDIASYFPKTECRDEPKLDPIAWYCFDSGNSTHPGGQKKPNAWGLFDMLGNAGEWVQDWYDGVGYGAGPLTDPEGSMREGRYAKVFRGGSANLWSTRCRAATRIYASPDSHGVGLGVRLARTLP